VTETLALRCSSAALLPCPKDSSAVATAKTPVLAGATDTQTPAIAPRQTMRFDWGRCFSVCRQQINCATKDLPGQARMSAAVCVFVAQARTDAGELLGLDLP
jgi:hypothetical protein